MQVRYAASIEKKSDGKAVWSSNDRSVFQKVSDSQCYIKEIYFLPSDPPESVYVWVIGHEQATKNKAIFDRLLQRQWIFHICVKGKGYYNNRMLTRGDCFLSTPFFKHSITADYSDPLEFYWFVIRGEGKEQFITDCGFRQSELVFQTPYTDEIVRLFELAMSTDYAKTNIYDFSMAFVRMVFSYVLHGISLHGTTEDAKNEKKHSLSQKKNYTDMVRKMLRDSNYSTTVFELAEKLGVTPNYLGKVFYFDEGEPLKKYIMRKRFELAELLLQQGIPPTEVASAVGYGDYAAFYSAFVSRFAVSPSGYAKAFFSQAVLEREAQKGSDKSRKT